jgi:hypothetical protein
MNSSSPTCLSRRLPPPMLSNCTCIVGPLSRFFQMRIGRSTPIVGAATLPGGRSAGWWCRNGCGTCGWNWGTCSHLNPYRTTEFAPALPEVKEQPSRICGDGKPSVAAPWKAGRFSGQDFVAQPDATLRCPAGQSLHAHERRKEADGSLRVVYAASIRSCRPCPLREQCQWTGSTTAKPRQVSVLLHPVVVGSEPLLWKDWSRRRHRRACQQGLGTQHVEIQVKHTDPPTPPEQKAVILSREQRAHYRLSWPERLVRNAAGSASHSVSITLFGIPDAAAYALGLI